MEELIFFAVLIFFSIVESIARSRKQRKGGGQLPEIPDDASPEWERAERPRPRPAPAPQPRPRMSDVPSYDDDPSFDARATSEREPSFDEVAASEEERRRRAASSESMIPADLWEEIAGLAREARVELPAPRPKPQPRLPPKPQQLPQPPRRGPQPSRPVPKSAPKTPQPSRPTAPPRKPPAPQRPLAIEGTAAHPVHLSHAGYGTDPSERVRSAQDVRESAVPVHGDALAVRSQLRGQRASALRQAMILHEVLGPPVSSKPDRFSD